MIIAFFGDSFTEGTPNNVDDPDIWPNIVGKHFEATVHNEYHPGGSNHAIMRKVVHYLMKNKPDLIIVTWSHWNRSEIHYGEKAYQMQPKSKSFPSKLIRQHYNNMDMNQQHQDWVDKVWIVDQLLKNKISHFQWCAFPREMKYNMSFVPENWMPSALMELMEDHTPCGHPTKIGHKKIAEVVIDHLHSKQIVL